MPDRVVRISLGFVNAYLVTAKGGFVLVDTGMSGQWNQLEAAMRGAGCAPGQLKLAVMTHADRDHVGNCRKLKETFKVPIAIHAADAPALQTGVSPKRTGRTFSARLMMGLMGMASRRAQRRTPASAIAPDVVLADGQRLDAWGLAAKVVHLPGHTRGSIGVLTDDGHFVAGDTCVNRKAAAPSPFVESFSDYSGSLEKMRAMAGTVSRVYPGHGAPFEGKELERLKI